MPETQMCPVCNQDPVGPNDDACPECVALARRASGFDTGVRDPDAMRLLRERSARGGKLNDEEQAELDRMLDAFRSPDGLLLKDLPRFAGLAERAGITRV